MERIRSQAAAIESDKKRHRYHMRRELKNNARLYGASIGAALLVGYMSTKL